MAITPFVSDIEMNRNIILNARFHSAESSSVISNPQDGQYYLNTTENKVYFYRTSDNKWHEIGDGAIYTAGTGIEISKQFVISVKQEILDNVSKNAAGIVDLQNDVNEISDTIVTIQGDITENTEKIEEVEKNVTIYRQEILSIETNITSIQNQVTNLGNRVTDVEQDVETNSLDITSLKNDVAKNKTNIQTNANDISALRKRVETNETDIESLSTEVELVQTDITDLQTNKLDKNFTSSLITDIQVKRNSVTDISVVESSINPETGMTKTDNNLIPLVDTLNTGLATPEMFNTIESNKKRIEKLEQLGGHYIGQSFATYDDLISYAILDTVNIGDFTYVLDDEEHESATTRYIVGIGGSGDKEFQFAYIINYDPVGHFTQDEFGLIKGKNQDGYVFAESDGTGSVVGWDALVGRTSSLETNLNALDSRLTTHISVDFSSLKNDYGKTKTQVNTNTTDISNLKTNKADKSKLQSVLTDILLNVSADENEKNNVLKIQTNVYNALTDASEQKEFQLPLSSKTNAGLLSVDQFNKLNEIESGAQVNQNAFSYVKAGDYTLTAETQTDTFELVAGKNIYLDTDPETNQITLNSEVDPADIHKATWKESGLQSNLDKEREDKMGEEIWEATMDEEGNYTIDLKDYEGYVGTDSHIFVKFMDANISANPTLKILSTTTPYEQIGPSPIRKYAEETPEKGFILKESIWELVYKEDAYFYMVASSGASATRSGKIDGSEDGTYLIASADLSGIKDPFFSVSFLITAVGYGSGESSEERAISDSLSSFGILTLSGDTSNLSLNWETRNNLRADYLTEADSTIDLYDVGLVPFQLDKFKCYREGTTVNLCFEKVTAQSMFEISFYNYRYEVLTSGVSDGVGSSSSGIDKLDIEVYENKKLETVPEEFVLSTEHVVRTTTDVANHNVNSIVKLTKKEFDQLKEENHLVPGTMYNITDDSGSGGGSGGANVTVLTQAEYDELVSAGTIDESMLYMIPVTVYNE